jgi:hypothetical protein
MKSLRPPLLLNRFSRPFATSDHHHRRDRARDARRRPDPGRETRAEVGMTINGMPIPGAPGMATIELAGIL